MKSISPRLLSSLFAVAAVFAVTSCHDDDCHHHHVHPDDAHHHHDHHCHHFHFSSGGTVVVFATDQPRDGLQSLYLSVTEIVLLGDGLEPQPVYRSYEGHRIDLLSLRGSRSTRLLDLIALAELPAATYDTARVFVKDPMIVLASGEEVEAGEIDLVAEGRIDIVLARPIVLSPSDVVFVVLDFDVERSVSSVERGDQRFRLRPLVLVDVLRGDMGEAARTPIEISGRILDVDSDAGLFDLELADGRGLLEVAVADDALVLGPDLQPTVVESIESESTVRVRGHFDGEGRLEARSLTLGETFQVAGVIRDLVIEYPGTDVDFSVELTPGGSVEGKLFVSADQHTVLTCGRLDGVVPEVLRKGVPVVVTGRRLPGMSKNSCRAACIDLKPECHRGTLVGISRYLGDLEIHLDDSGGKRSVFGLEASTEIFLGDSTGLELSALRAGDQVTVYGNRRESPSAAAVILEPARVSGVVTGVTREGRLFVVTPGGALRSVTVARDATILLVEEAEGFLEQTPIVFEDIEKGMKVEAEGLSETGFTSHFLVVTLTGPSLAGGFDRQAP